MFLCQDSLKTQIFLSTDRLNFFAKNYLLLHVTETLMLVATIQLNRVDPLA